MTETSDPLVERARAAALGAYAPYSRFSVGCAIESVDGRIAIGANMENACYRLGVCAEIAALTAAQQAFGLDRDRKSTRLNSSHLVISYAVFCLKKKKKEII